MGSMGDRPPEELVRQVDRVAERLAAQTRTPIELLAPGRNPWPKGSMLAAHWELGRRLRVLGWTLYYHHPLVRIVARVMRWVWSPTPG